MNASPLRSVGIAALLVAAVGVASLVPTLRIARERAPIDGLESEPFFPPADPEIERAFAVVRAVHADEAVDAPGFPGWLTSYVGGKAHVADLARGVAGAARAVPPSPSLKIDRLLPGERSIPRDGGWKGVAVDPGLDGVVLRHEDREFRYLPSWGIERSPGRSRLVRDAREAAREAGWSKDEAKAAAASVFRTRAYVSSGDVVHPVQRGNIDVPAVEAAILRDRIALAAGYLTRETDGGGRITYEYQPREDKTGNDYNMLRHAGTAYSMFQAHRLRPDPALWDATVRAMGFLKRKMKEDANHPGEWFVLDGKSAKLGGAGLALIAFVEMAKADASAEDRAAMQGLARHILRMQHEDGDFESFYDWQGKGVSDRASIYYPGEAILGLTRLHEWDGDPLWLDAAVRGANFLVGPRWKALGLRLYVPPDAWLLQALDELDRLAPDAARRDYALAVADTIARNKLYVDGVAEDFYGADMSGPGSLPNAATAGSFGEALSAAARIEARAGLGTRYRDYALANARFQLRHQFTADNAWFLPNPGRALGGFRLKPDDHEIRNDYVQHNLSGLFGLLPLLDPAAPDPGWVRR